MHRLQSLPSVAIIGRSNVGKSTLFNKIVEQNRALILPEAGTTRDYLSAPVQWQRRTFNLIDTGGLDPVKGDSYHDAIIQHSLAAQKQAAVLVWVVDATVPLAPADLAIARQLRRWGPGKGLNPCLLAINKCDNARLRAQAENFRNLNLPLYPVSAKNGSGVGDLLDAITAALPGAPENAPAEADMTLALIGKPNVGKSSLLNRLYGEERMIVSPLPHTTRDSQDVLIQHQDVIIKIIDTAGIRRRGAGNQVEELSVAKARQAATRADVVGLVIDISKSITSQDKRLAEEITDLGKGIFIIANKWDLIPEKDSATIEKYERYVAAWFPYLTWAPIIFTSAVSGQRAGALLDLAVQVRRNLAKQLTEEELKLFLKTIIARRRPTTGKGTRRPSLLSLEQTGTNPLRLVTTIPIKTNLAETYKRFMINSLRAEFGLEGVPIRLAVREKVTK